MTKPNFNTIPDTPGVYIFRDGSNKPLYVGKAGNLKNRLQSYFGGGLVGKTANMLAKAEKFDTIQTLSEVEALILESQLIKSLKPYYNKALKDDKSYQYIEVAAEEYPKVTRVRKKGQGVHFGPFPEGKIAFEIYRITRQIFKFRDCSLSKFKQYARLKKGCLYFDLGLCSAPCAGKIGKREYRQNINGLRAFLGGQSTTIEKQWQANIKKCQKKNQFEKAARIKQQLESLNSMRSQRVKPTEYLANPNLREAIRRQELAGLYKVLPQLAPKIPFSKFTIEGFDISNLAGTAAVGAKVSFTRGEPNKRSYRRYKIKTVRGISDTAMMQEVLQRRLQSKGDQPLPHLILVDGGKGQVSKALAVLKNLDLGIPLIGLAKGKETIVYYTGEGFSKLRLPRDHPALQLLQRVRDEAHRFGLSYHHKIRLQPIG